MRRLRTGKIGHELLAKMLSKHTSKGEGIVVGPKVGEDAAVVEVGEKWVVATADPITYTSHRIGWYSVHINANDVASLGGVPKYFLATLLLPEDQATEGLVEEAFSNIDEACRSLGVVLIGGHTEVTPGLGRMVVCGAMIGEVEKDKLVTSSGAKPGDLVILTKGIAIEGTSIIARHKEAELIGKYGEEWVERAKSFLESPGISILREAVAANRAAVLSSLHDPTEGGLATGLREVAVASEVGVEVEYEKLAIFPETEVICNDYGLDPLGLIASGALIVTCSPAQGDRVEEALDQEGIAHSLIGRVTEQGLWVLKEGKREILPEFESDELTKVL